MTRGYGNERAMGESSTEEILHEVIEIQTERPDWWITRQARYLAKRLEELQVGQAIIVSQASTLALDEDDVKEVVGRYPAGTFKVFARFGGCEIVRQKVKEK